MLDLEKDYIVTTLSDGTLKMAHVKGEGAKLKLLHIIKKDVKDIAKEELPKIARSALESAGLKKARTICVIPSSVATTKNIEIPSIDPAEIKSIIDLQAGRHTPYSREEILIGYINIGVFQKNYTKVLLVIVNRQVVKDQFSIFAGSGFKVERIVFAPECKAAFYGMLLERKADDLPAGIIDIGRYSTDFTVEFNNTIIASRNIPLGLDHLFREGVPARDKMIQELTTSLESYQNEDIHKLPETFILTSDDAKVKELEPILKEKFKANVRIISYWDHVAATQPMMLKIVSEFNDESFLDVIATVPALRGIRIDLTPDEIKVQHSIEERGRQVLQVCMFGLMLLLLLCAIFFSKLHFRGQYLERLVKEYNTKRSAVEELERISTNTKIVHDYLKSRMTSLDVINELYEKIPNEIYLKNINFEEDGSIHLQGISESRSTAFALITVLENSVLFKNVKMVSSSAQKDRGKDVSAFEISLKLESAPDEETPAAAEGGSPAAEDGEKEEKAKKEKEKEEKK